MRLSGNKTIVIVVIAIAFASVLFLQRRAANRLREENEALRAQAEELAHLNSENQQLSNHLAGLNSKSPWPKLPAPQTQIDSITEPGSESIASNSIFSEIAMGGEGPQMTGDEIQSYLKENRRNAASLLTAFRATKDTNLLTEALEKYPNDPQVHYASLFASSSPEERRQRVDAFKQTAPENALGNYLSAFDYLKAGQNDLAIQELKAAGGKDKFTDYSLEFLQNAEEAWRSAGYSVADAKTLSCMQLLLPDLQELRELGRKTVALANSYREAGDEASAQALLQMNIGLGKRFTGAPGEALVSQLVGIAIEADALRAMPPGAEFGAGQTVQQRFDELTRQRNALKDLSKMENLLPSMPPQDVISYWDRWRGFGSESTLRWAGTKYQK